MSVACGSDGQGRPLLLGELDDSAMAALTSDDGASGALHLRVNREVRVASLAADRTFAIQDLPTGELTFTVDLAKAVSTLVLENVAFGELLEVKIARDGARLSMDVVRRDRASSPRSLPPARHGDLVVHDSGIYYLDPGEYPGPLVVDADGVRLVGAYDGCDTVGRTRIGGDLIVRGADVQVINVDVGGGVRVESGAARLYDSCPL